MNQERAHQASVASVLHRLWGTVQLTLGRSLQVATSSATLIRMGRALVVAQRREEKSVYITYLLTQPASGGIMRFHIAGRRVHARPAVPAPASSLENLSLRYFT
jgi:hypothetical protein